MEGGSDPSESGATAQPTAGPGLRLAEYAAAKKLPVEFLEALGCTNITVGTPVVKIPYRDHSGEERAARLRLRLTGDIRFKWRSGDKPLLYGRGAGLALYGRL